MLEVAVRKRLGSFELDAAFTAPAGGVTALFGRSGAGKTSVVNAIAGLLRPDWGRIRVGGVTFFDRDAGIHMPVTQRRIGYVFQDARLFPHMSVRDNLLYGWRRVPAAERRIAFDPVVDLLGLAALLRRRPRHLSGGERQRVALGRALLAQPRVLLMDEPLASLDAPRKAEIIPYIERLRDELGLPIVLVSHAVEEVVRLATTVVLLDQGRVAAAGPVGEIMGRLDLEGLTGLHDAGAVLDCRVAAHHEGHGLTTLDFPGGQLRVPRLGLALGTRLQVRIHARDVILALRPPEQLSVQNVLPGRIREIGAVAEAFVEVQIDLGGSTLIARVTRRAALDLALAPGMPVYALVKSVAFDRHSLMFAPGAGWPRPAGGVVHL